MTLEILTLRGTEATTHLPDLARLRIRVFREYPYLYDGSPDYEERYLSKYFSTAESILVLGREPHDGRIVGASTAMPMHAAEEVFQTAFQSSGRDLPGTYYLGESVLLPEYRGQGLGHRFFDEREAAARKAGFHTTAFCAVVRPPDHPQRPDDYRPLDGFWTRRGYIHHPEIRVSLDWKEPGEMQESPHQLSFWIRE